MFTRYARIPLVAMSLTSLLLGCSTPLLNLNTLDLASTFSDVTVRQIVFNLAKTKENMWFVPSQVQLNNGIIAARTNLTPSVTTPIGSTLYNTTTIARALTTTTTTAAETVSSNPSASLGATAEDTSTWNVSPIQDPEPLKRLQLLYQYGAGWLRAVDLLCLYPIPEKPEAAKPQKSDLQALADALREKKDDDKKEKGKDKPATDAGSETKYYIRGEYFGSCKNVSAAREFDAPLMLVGSNPDLAFLTPPVCVLCAYPNRSFQKRIQNAVNAGVPIYTDRNTDTTVPRKANAKYIPVVLNAELSPLEEAECGGVAPDGRHHWEQRNLLQVDWLFVDREGSELPPGRTVIGASNGFIVSTTCYENFAEFVLAIREATLQSPLLEKAGSPAPPVVQTTTGR